MPDDVTFRELDTKHGWVKGTAFRRFKAALPVLVEGQDFRRLDARHDKVEIEALRATGRIYATTVHAVLLGVRARALIEDQ